MLATETKALTAPVQTVRGRPSAPAWNEIMSGVEPFLHAVNRRLAEQIRAFDLGIANYAEYALTGQGKQLRPALVALTGGATGEVVAAHEEVAVIIEMIHLATLVHDDVVDEAQIRRARPTLAASWGNEIAVLLGDCLFAHALKLAAGFPTTEICRAVSAATNTVCAGEILQTQAQHDFKLSRRDYFKTLRMKTGELFALSCDLGAYLSGAEAGQRLALRQYGLAMGTAYQVFDDCLDLFGSEAIVGKSLGTDLVKGKLTLPVLLVLERAELGRRKQILSWLGEWQPEYYSDLRRYMSSYGVLAESRKVVEEYLDLARQMLKPLPRSENQASLHRLADYLGQQMSWLGQERPAVRE
jgi:octaprenyl-diphosphate synthase